MKTRANTTVRILRGTTTDAFGDLMSNTTPAVCGITASLIEQTKTVFNPDDGTIRQVRIYTCRLPAGTDFQTGDRIYDESTGVTYIADAATTPTNPVRGMDLRLDLRRTT